MRSIRLLGGCLVALAAIVSGQSNFTKPHSSKQILPNTFTPPQVYQHANLVRTINLAKEYAKETVNVVVENIEKAAQHEYYIPFEQGFLARVGGFEVRDKNVPEKLFEDVEIVEFDQERSVQ